MQAVEDWNLHFVDERSIDHFGDHDVRKGRKLDYECITLDHLDYIRETVRLDGKSQRADKNLIDLDCNDVRRTLRSCEE